MTFLKTSTLAKENDNVGSYVISSFDLAYNLSKIIDLVNPELSSHHHRVAYISAAIAAECGLDNDKMINVIIASLIHDIGVMLQTEFRELSKFDSENSEKMSHSYVGAFLIDKVRSFRHLSPIISKHHLKWINHPDTEEEALIIHLSDRIDVLLKRDAPAYYQRETVKDTISAYSGKFF